ncbi:hypothetical protein Lfu02_52170 [Longispora fulva]|uniref:Uncharacterized protein n=1 Tax=Longispora fulva TaxID=619741 RepID=A0A8J7GK05_9ACTN|nr:hypothetical protein [Longispora fulva]MBG6140889.1 hypothetical protein [Longispora fulva]GIG60845.1 hypothetical protein Lfu02_52170 [Longispora fulva]
MPRRVALTLTALLLATAATACGSAPEKKPAAAPSTSAPSPSATKLTDPEMYAMTKKALLPEDALTAISFPGKSEPETERVYQGLLVECHPGLSTDSSITGRNVRVWTSGEGPWALSATAGFQDTTAVQVIDEIRKTIPEKCHGWKATTPIVDRSVDYSSDVVLPELPGTTASYGYCLTVSFIPSGHQKSECAVFVGRKAAGMDMVASFHYSVENEAIAKATVAQLAPKVAEQLAKV